MAAQKYSQQVKQLNNVEQILTGEVNLVKHRTSNLYAHNVYNVGTTSYDR